MDTAVQQTDQLASAAVTGWATAFGVIIVVVILLAFWWGARRTRRRRVPLQNPGAGPQPGAGSWHEPQPSETHHTAHSHEDDDADR